MRPISRRARTGPFLWAVLWASGCTPKTEHTKDAQPDLRRSKTSDEDCSDTFPADILPEAEIDDMMRVERVYMEDALPGRLSETPLYSNIITKEFHPALRLYTPEFQLWSDGAEKARWVYVPECSTVDTSDMNNWDVPVGTRFFKEFRLDGRRIETRIISRVADGPRDFAYASYLWNDAETEATRVGTDGLRDVLGTAHDVPSKDACFQCHGSHALGGGRPSRGLGFSAIQLAHAESGLDLFELAENGTISHPPDRLPQIPGSSEERAALGYLHANCGNCHNDSKDRVKPIRLNLWLDVGLSSVEETGAWRTAVDQPTQIFNDQHVVGHIVSGRPQESALVYRMAQRGNTAQMPPVASEIVDVEGLATVTAWIEGLE